MHVYTKYRYTGCALTMRRFQCTQSSIHTIVTHDNIGNYIAQWSYNNNYMIANDACTSTLTYSRKRENEQSTPVKGYSSTDITLYKDCAIKKKIKKK